MKLARFTSPDGRTRHGIVTDTHAVALEHRIAQFATLLADPASRDTQPNDPRWPVADVAWQPPIEATSKVICVGLSYPLHAAESDRKPPEHVGRGFEIKPHVPLFLRFPDSFVGSGAAVVRPTESNTLDWEGEVVLVIGRAGRRIPAANAADHIAGFTCMAENSVREWQGHSAQATAGKNWTASGACGPWVATADEVGTDPLLLRTLLNGEQVQSDSTASLTIPFTEMIAYISTFTTLNPGDLIATGTPNGIGYRQNPPRYLRPGDVLSVEVSRVGTLHHTVTDDAVSPPIERAAALAAH